MAKKKEIEEITVAPDEEVSEEILPEEATDVETAERDETSEEETEKSEDEEETPVAEEPKKKTTRRTRASQKESAEESIASAKEKVDSKLIDDDLFNARSVSTATLDEKHQLYAQDFDGVLGRFDGDDSVIVKTPKDIKKEQIDHLKQETKTIPPSCLKGVVQSFRKTSDSDSGEWVVSVKEVLSGAPNDNPELGPVEILIPYSQFTAALDETPEISDLMITNDLNGRLGAVIDFSVVHVDEKAETVFATRLYPMQIKGYKYFIQKQRDINVPRFIDGMLAQALVIGVRRDRVVVSIGGVECIIRSAELSWTALDTLENEFHVGDAFYVKLSNIRSQKIKVGNKSYTLIRLHASKKDAEINPAKEAVKHFREGEMCGGVIKAFTDNGMVFVRVKDEMDCLCTPPSSGVPVRGQQCTVLIKEVNTEKKTLYGSISRM